MPTCRRGSSHPAALTSTEGPDESTTLLADTGRHRQDQRTWNRRQRPCRSPDRQPYAGPLPRSSTTLPQQPLSSDAASYAAPWQSTAPLAARCAVPRPSSLTVA
ncbi:hypothetical protein TNIN_185871 [Trichonephila inaurata madagascariensis]|uniref:Uncharacterized protein n=1 Tax=Trichonephila inaurata madagascariensis TaxID=2747483 RepID=A0A8X7C8B4_9ARAC|nr:hypothetical protein TNIN_185871 [Trichonephila inaurata madagascariensis]